ncbi:MAG: hypothetical protein AAGF71_13600 [Pseudomonadota bacterium]
MDWHAQEPPARHPLHATAFDNFELKLVPVFRHFIAAFRGQGLNAAHRGYDAASVAFGPATGLQIAHRFSATVMGLHQFGKPNLEVHDPLNSQDQHFLTQDELLFFEMIHYMRRNATHAAKGAISTLTDGRMDAGFMHEALTFARDHGVGVKRQTVPRPKLRLVKA